MGLMAGPAFPDPALRFFQDSLNGAEAGRGFNGMGESSHRPHGMSESGLQNGVTRGLNGFEEDGGDLHVGAGRSLHLGHGLREMEERRLLVDAGRGSREMNNGGGLPVDGGGGGLHRLVGGAEEEDLFLPPPATTTDSPENLRLRFTGTYYYHIRGSRRIDLRIIVYGTLKNTVRH